MPRLPITLLEAIQYSLNIHAQLTPNVSMISSFWRTRICQECFKFRSPLAPSLASVRILAKSSHLAPTFDSFCLSFRHNNLRRCACLVSPSITPCYPRSLLSRPLLLRINGRALTIPTSLVIQVDAFSRLLAEPPIASPATRLTLRGTNGASLITVLPINGAAVTSSTVGLSTPTGAFFC